MGTKWCQGIKFNRSVALLTYLPYLHISPRDLYGGKAMEVVALDYALAEWLLNDYPFSYIHETVIKSRIQKFYKDKSYENRRISYIRREDATDETLNAKITSISTGGIIKDTDQHGVYAISGKPSYKPEEIVCAVYPHGYLSFISAMRWYNITDRNPKTVKLTVPSRQVWKAKAMQDAEPLSLDPKYYVRNLMIPYPSPGKFLDFELDVIREMHFEDPISIKNSPIKVSPIGKTFVDMTRRPSDSGGIEHVADVFSEHGKIYSRQIINYADRHGTKIDRARIGFILSTLAEVDVKILEKWKDEAKGQRGGSRKLNPEGDFSSFYSEEWSISINVGKLQKYAQHD